MEIIINKGLCPNLPPVTAFTKSFMFFGMVVKPTVSNDRAEKLHISIYTKNNNQRFAYKLIFLAICLAVFFAKNVGDQRCQG
jgi:hypothetical protein